MLNEMAYPASFNQNYFETLTSFRARVMYCRERLPFIGAGSARAVYKIDDEKVLKLAKNKKGIGQNEVEGQSYWDIYGIFAKLIDTHPEYHWVEMELARKAKLSDFNKIIGKPNAFEEWLKPYMDLVRSRYDGTRGIYAQVSEEKKQELEEFENTPEFEDNLLWRLQFYMCDTQITTLGDLKRLSSWGVVIRDGKEELVLVDYGYNEYVRDTYYVN